MIVKDFFTVLVVLPKNKYSLLPVKLKLVSTQHTNAIASKSISLSFLIQFLQLIPHDLTIDICKALHTSFTYFCIYRKIKLGGHPALVQMHFTMKWGIRSTLIIYKYKTNKLCGRAIISSQQAQGSMLAIYYWR